MIIISKKYIYVSLQQKAVNTAFVRFNLVRPRGIEPPHPAPEAGALSTELRAHIKLVQIFVLNTIMIIAKQKYLVKM